MKPAISKMVRQLKIEGSRIVPYVTEKVDRKSVVITHKNGSSVVLRPNHLTKELRSFLEATGSKVQFQTYEARRGRRIIAGCKVKVLPITHNHFDNGVFIWVEDESNLSYSNVNKVNAYLQSKGFDIAKECVLVIEKSREGSCLFKRGQKPAEAEA